MIRLPWGHREDQTPLVIEAAAELAKATDDLRGVTQQVRDAVGDREERK